MAVGGLLDFGLRVATGQPPGKAAYGAAGSAAGSIVGGALAGPVGAVID